MKKTLQFLYLYCLFSGSIFFSSHCLFVLYLDFIISFRKIVPECILICVVFFNYWQVFQYFQLATIFEIRLKEYNNIKQQIVELLGFLCYDDKELVEKRRHVKWKKYSIQF